MQVKYLGNTVTILKEFCDEDTAFDVVVKHSDANVVIDVITVLCDNIKNNSTTLHTEFYDGIYDTSTSWFIDDGIMCNAEKREWLAQYKNAISVLRAM